MTDLFRPSHYLLLVRRTTARDRFETITVESNRTLTPEHLDAIALDLSRLMWREPVANVVHNGTDQYASISLCRFRVDDGAPVTQYSYRRGGRFDTTGRVHNYEAISSG